MEARSAMFWLRWPSCIEPFGVMTPIMFFRPKVTPAPPWSLSLGALMIVLSKAVLAILTLLRAREPVGRISTNSSLLRSTSLTPHLSSRASTPATLKALKVSEWPQPSPTTMSATPCCLR